MKGNESSQPDVPSFDSAVLLLSRGPSFPGARASSPLSRSTTLPPWKASRHRFEFRVFRRIAFPRRRAFTAVPDLLGSRACFQALCLTPHFFEPRRRRTNSAFTQLVDARARSSNSYPRPPRLVSLRFNPTSVTRRGRCEPRNSSWGCTSMLSHRSPSSRGHRRERM